MKLMHYCLLKSNLHIPTYAGLFNGNVTLLLRIAAKLLSNIFCGIKLGVDVLF